MTSHEGRGLYRRPVLTALLFPKVLLRKLLGAAARSEIVHPRMRVWAYRLIGVRFCDASSVFIGANVYIDEMAPSSISIGRNVLITEGAKILAHFYDTDGPAHRFLNGNVIIEDDVFIGFNVIVAKPVTIGKGAVIGANTVVTKDIPDHAIVVGSGSRIVGRRPRDG